MIVVTGVGLISASGDDPDALWDDVVRGASPAVSFADPAVPGSPAIPACVVPGPGVDTLRRRRSHRMDRCVQLALEAASRASDDAGLRGRPADPTRLGVTVGTSRGPMSKWTESIDLARSGRREMPPTFAADSTLGCLAGAVARDLGAAGPSLTAAATCASAAYAIALAAQQITLGEADVMVAGGADAPLLDAVIRQTLSTVIIASHGDPRRACRPFDINRKGTLLAEGAAFLVLESAASARRRGAPVLARLIGWATATDPAHRSSPSENGDGLVRAMRRALEVARLDADAVDYVNAHGTGTPLNDRIEAVSMRRVFGGRAGSVACSSTKPVTGHCLGASSALEAIISILSLRHGLIPPTANCDELDPECTLDIVRGAARPAAIRVAMSNSLGFWGTNASLIFGLDDPPAGA